MVGGGRELGRGSFSNLPLPPRDTGCGPQLSAYLFFGDLQRNTRDVVALVPVTYFDHKGRARAGPSLGDRHLMGTWSAFFGPESMSEDPSWRKG